MYRLRCVVLVAVVLAVTGPLASMAVAGGWAVTSLDSNLPALSPGTTVEVGYTILQHGQRPVDLEDTGIEISSAGAAPVFFAGRRDGAVGHYSATITVPREASEWTVRQGWFGPQPLGAMPLDRTEPAATATGGDPGPVWWILLGATLISLLALLVQVVHRRGPAVQAG